MFVRTGWLIFFSASLDGGETLFTSMLVSQDRGKSDSCGIPLKTRRGGFLSDAGCKLSLRDHFPVIFLIKRDDFIGAIVFGGVPAAGLGHAVVEVIVGEQSHDARGLSADVAGRFQEAVFALGDQLGDAA